jgi:hypothetical protein
VQLLTQVTWSFPYLALVLDMSLSPSRTIAWDSRIRAELEAIAEPLRKGVKEKMDTFAHQQGIVLKQDELQSGGKKLTYVCEAQSQNVARTVKIKKAAKTTIATSAAAAVPELQGFVEPRPLLVAAALTIYQREKGVQTIARSTLPASAFLLMNRPQKHSFLVRNGQVSETVTDHSSNDLIARCLDVYVNGVLPRCAVCFGQLVFHLESRVYKCNGAFRPEAGRAMACNSPAIVHPRRTGQCVVPSDCLPLFAVPAAVPPCTRCIVFRHAQNRGKDNAVGWHVDIAASMWGVCHCLVSPRVTKAVIQARLATAPDALDVVLMATTGKLPQAFASVAMQDVPRTSGQRFKRMVREANTAGAEGKVLSWAKAFVERNGGVVGVRYTIGPDLRLGSLYVSMQAGAAVITEETGSRGTAVDEFVHEPLAADGDFARELHAVLKATQKATRQALDECAREFTAAAAATTAAGQYVDDSAAAVDPGVEGAAATSSQPGEGAADGASDARLGVLPLCAARLVEARASLLDVERKLCGLEPHLKVLGLSATRDLKFDPRPAVDEERTLVAIAVVPAAAVHVAKYGALPLFGIDGAAMRTTEEGTDAKGCLLVLEMTDASAHIMPLAIVYCYSESSANLDFMFDCTRRAGFDLNSPVVISMDRGKAGIASVQRLAHAMPRFCIQHIIRNIQKEQGNKLPLDTRPRSDVWRAL